MKKVFVIAEIGINHAGNVDLAESMIIAAKAAGADMAKFQIYRPEEVLGSDSEHYAEAKKAELSHEQHSYLKRFCDAEGIEWGASVFHIDSIAFLEDIGIKRYKIASRSIRDAALLKEIRKTGKPAIVSTGDASIRDIEEAVNILNRPALMYCVSKYPTAINEIGLKGMECLSKYSSVIGFSSHCPSQAPTLAAVARGGKIVENHIRLDYAQKGPDMSSSMHIDDYARMISIIRDMEAIWN